MRRNRRKFKPTSRRLRSPREWPGQAVCWTCPHGGYAVTQIRPPRKRGLLRRRGLPDRVRVLGRGSRVGGRCGVRGPS